MKLITGLINYTDMNKIVEGYHEDLNLKFVKYDSVKSDDMQINKIDQVNNSLE